jgi:hypothetical protein
VASPADHVTNENVFKPADFIQLITTSNNVKREMSSFSINGNDNKKICVSSDEEEQTDKQDDQTDKKEDKTDKKADKTVEKEDKGTQTKDLFSKLYMSIIINCGKS